MSAGRLFIQQRNLEFKDRAARVVHARADLPTVRKEDLAAYCQAEAHPLDFGAVQGGEKLLRIVDREAGPRIGERHAKISCVRLEAGDMQLPSVLAILRHGVHCVVREIDHDLLDLNAIGVNSYRCVIKGGEDGDTFVFGASLDKGERVPHGLDDIDLG
jgi:hypothetical protein